MDQKQNLIAGAFLIVLGASLISTGLGYYAVRFVLIALGLIVLSKGLVRMTGRSLVDWIDEVKSRFF